LTSKFLKMKSKILSFIKSATLFFVSKTFLGILLSVLLLRLSFPKFDFGFLAWIAFIPLLLVIPSKGGIRSFLISYLAGVLFFWSTIYWFVYVTGLGAVLLIFYFAVYFGIFGLGYHFFSHRSTLEKILVLPSIWVALEFARGHLLTGFNWVSLGLSQYQNITIIQMADLTGFYGVSFLVMMVNVFGTEWFLGRIQKRSFSRQPGFLAFGLVGLTLIGAWAYGVHSLKNFSGQDFPYDRTMNVSVIQGNIPQEMKWDSEYWPWILKKQKTLTQEAVQDKPDLIIWPETSFPGFVWDSPKLFEDLKDFTVSLKTPLLLGLVTKMAQSYFNSAQWINEEGYVSQQYDKLHLVPFGEYVPLRNFVSFIPILKEMGDFTPGQEYTLFPVGQGHHLSVLICFEDTVPELSRGFVKAGANLLVNITNDAWFGDTVAPFLHLQSAVFRAVENRRYLIRCANTGVSAFVDHRGEVFDYVKDEQGKKAFTAGFSTSKVALLEGQTFYTKLGDVFTYFCFGCILIGAIRKKP